MVNMVVAVAPVCGVTELGEKEHVANVGRPEHENVVAASNPLRLATVIVRLADWPAAIFAVGDDAAMLKSAVAGGGVVFAVSVAKRPCCSFAKPAVKKSVLGSPVPPAPNTRSHSEPFTIAWPFASWSWPTRLPV